MSCGGFRHGGTDLQGFFGRKWYLCVTMRHLAVILWVALLLPGWTLFAQNGPTPRFVNYTAADGLPSNTVYAVTQDAEGALWIGTRNGLARFDGVCFQNWKEYGRVNALTVDKAGRLWVGSTQGLRVQMPEQVGHDVTPFIEPSYLIVAIIGILVFSIFNFRPKGKAKCFAGDVCSIGIAFIILFALGRLMLATKDVTYIVFFLVYGIDGTLTIIHRIMLHENLGQAHRKHAYQLMANEQGMSHVVVSLLYMGMQLVVSLGFIYLCPNTMLAHWIYLIGAAAILAVAYILFMKKYYHLHEEYLASLKR